MGYDARTSEALESRQRFGLNMRQLHIALIFVVFVAATADSKTVLYGTQGLHDKTCPEIASDMGLDCPLATADISAARCRTECKSEENAHPCYHMDEASASAASCPPLCK